MLNHRTLTWTCRVVVQYSGHTKNSVMSCASFVATLHFYCNHSVNKDLALMFVDNKQIAFYGI